MAAPDEAGSRWASPGEVRPEEAGVAIATAMAVRLGTGGIWHMTESERARKPGHCISEEHLGSNEQKTLLRCPIKRAHFSSIMRSPEVGSYCTSSRVSTKVFPL